MTDRTEQRLQSTTLVINPGSGPVAGDEAQAWHNIKQLVVDLALPFDISMDSEGSQQDGRHRFRLAGGGNEAEIDMPGLPLERVRWMDRDDQDIWDFPRLYVEGSSWVWLYAIKAARRVLAGEDD